MLVFLCLVWSTWSSVSQITAALGFLLRQATVDVILVGVGAPYWLMSSWWGCSLLVDVILVGCSLLWSSEASHWLSLQTSRIKAVIGAGSPTLLSGGTRILSETQARPRLFSTWSCPVLFHVLRIESKVLPVPSKAKWSISVLLQSPAGYQPPLCPFHTAGIFPPQGIRTQALAVWIFFVPPCSSFLFLSTSCSTTLAMLVAHCLSSGTPDLFNHVSHLQPLGN